MDINLLSNSELRVKMSEMENEYDSLKVKISECINRMDILDKKYNKMKSILNKRTNGRI